MSTTSNDAITGKPATETPVSVSTYNAKTDSSAAWNTAQKPPVLNAGKTSTVEAQKSVTTKEPASVGTNSVDPQTWSVLPKTLKVSVPAVIKIARVLPCVTKKPSKEPAVWQSNVFRMKTAPLAKPAKKTSASVTGNSARKSTKPTKTSNSCVDHLENTV
jgi:hypothetical protein